MVSALVAQASRQLHTRLSLERPISPSFCCVFQGALLCFPRPQRPAALPRSHPAVTTVSGLTARSGSMCGERVGDNVRILFPPLCAHAAVPSSCSLHCHNNSFGSSNEVELLEIMLVGGGLFQSRRSMGKQMSSFCPS